MMFMVKLCVIEANTLISIVDSAQVSKLISAEDLPETASATSALIDYEALFIYLFLLWIPSKNVGSGN